MNDPKISLSNKQKDKQSNININLKSTDFTLTEQAKRIQEYKNKFNSLTDRTNMDNTQSQNYKYFKIANINKHITLHELRHSCATWLFSLGVPITVISKIMRHRDIATTMSTYTHLIKKDYIDELNRINEYKQAQK